MSVSEDRTVQPTPITPAPGSGIADPGPLGLAAFALTTFLLSARNAGWMTHATGDAWLGFALAYGGLAQLLAAMWEFRNRNVVGATAFGTFGAFWIGLGFWILLVVNPPVAAIRPATAAGDGHGHQPRPRLDPARVRRLHHVRADPGHSDEHGPVHRLPPPMGHLDRPVHRELQRWRSTPLAPTTTIKIGGYLGVVTAAAAWYTSAAGMAAGIGGKLRFPVGPALIK